MALTGRYYLGDYRSNDAQYKGLMDAGITAAKALNLRPGIALTAEQVAQLTTDIVWIEEQTITLADGSTQKALVPKVYTRQAVGQIDGTGSLIAANNLAVNVTGNVNNQGQLVGHNTLNVKALNLTNENGGVIAGDYLQLNTTEDLTNKSLIKAGSAANLDIGGNFNNQSETYSTSSAQGLSFGSRTGISQLASIYVGDTLKGQTDENGNPLITFNANVGGNTTFDAGILDNQGGSTRINTKGDTHLNAVTTGYQTNAIGDANNYFKQGETRDIGSRITGTDNVTIISGSDITGKAVTINSDNGTVGLKAGKDITLTEGRHTQNLSTANKTTDRGFLSKTTTQNRFDSQSDTAISNDIQGDKIIMDADNNLSLTATNAISDHGTYLKAGNNVDILAAQNTSSTTSESSTKKSGVFSSGGLGFTIGKQKQDNDNAQTALTHTASTIGAIDGNVGINAGNHIQQTGSNVIAGIGENKSVDSSDKERGNIVYQAKAVDIDNAMDVYTNQSEQKFKQSGLTVSVSNSLMDNAQNFNRLINAASNTSSPRMKGLAAGVAGLKAKALYEEGSQALNALQAGNLKDVGNTRIQATIGSSKSQANSQSYREQSQGSSITTNNLALIATGGGSDSNININGSDVSVANNALFKADNDFNINGVAQKEQTRSNNKSSSFGVGVYASTNPSGEGASYGITANASKGKGHANSDGTTYANSHINVGGTTTFDIGNDVNIKGGVLTTDELTGQVAGDLNMESLQDTYVYDSKQKNAGFSADLDLASGAGSNLSLNGGKTNLNADYAAVTEQTGVYTQKADLNVGGKGVIKGTAYTTASAEDNKSVFAQGIETSDIQNHSNHDAKAIAAGISIGKAKDTNPEASLNGIGYGTDSDNQTRTTKAGVTGMAGQSDVTTATKNSLNEPLVNSFDASTVNEELGAQVEITRAFDQERRKIKAELNKKEQKLRDEAQEALDNKDYGKARKKTLAADKVQKDSLLFDGISSALYGPNTNGATGYVAKAVSPQVANQIGQYFKKNDLDNAANNTNLAGEGSPEHLLAHALLGAAVSAATGNDALTGGISASSGEVTATLLSKYIYQVDKPSELTAEQKDTISNITTLAGVAIGSTTGEVTDAVNAGETAKVAVEDNHDSDLRRGMKRKTNAELARETWEMNHGPLGKFINRNQKYILIGTDFIPIIGDIKGFSEAKNVGDYIFASAGLVPLLGDGAKAAYKSAKASGNLNQMKQVLQNAINTLQSKGLVTQTSGANLINMVNKGEDVKPVISVPAGSKGNWDRSINQSTFKPNRQYKLSNGHTYITDSRGRVNKVEGELSLNKMDRNTNQQRNTGKAENATGDDGGHLIASSLGGAGDRINMVPQARTLNRGDWKKMENEVRNELKAGKSVSIKIDLDYANSSSSRPSKFIVNIKVDGKAKSPYIFEQ